jgi:serine/threonine protein kinase
VALTSGTRLGPYEIVSPLGAGGMGEVYRAHDTKLARDVALKLVPELFASDRDRLARFTREAQALAALNHPNIAHIHGLEENGGVRAIVMELVEGEDLAQRLVRGPVPVDEALQMARQIAEALEAAHEQGIIHRDLKPANIKVRVDGTVKVLDFGLAKALTADARRASSGPAAPANSPTITSSATGVGVVLGTAAYMAPEQAKGKPADTRVDIWAFGCVLFEMLSGTRAFDGDDISETVVSVLSKEADWQRIPKEASAARPLIARCLMKNPKQRLQAIGDARILIEELMSGSVEQPALSPLPRRSIARRLAPAALAAVVSSALTGSWQYTASCTVRP